MNAVIHSSARASHYNKEAKHYDAFNEKIRFQLIKL